MLADSLSLRVFLRLGVFLFGEAVLLSTQFKVLLGLAQRKLWLECHGFRNELIQFEFGVLFVDTLQNQLLTDRRFLGGGLCWLCW